LTSPAASNCFALGPRTYEEAHCTTVACSPDGRLVASAEYEGTIVLWDISSGREVTRFHPGEKRQVKALAFSPDGRTLASGGDDPTILLWTIPRSARKPN
jgi:WD40 repeat protein